MTLWLLPDLVAAFLNLALGVYVYRESQRKLLHSLFICFLVDLALWELSECKLFMADQATALLWIKSEYVAIFFSSALAAHFALVFFAGTERLYSRYALAYVPTVFLTALMLWTELVFSGVEPRPWGYGSVKGPLHPAFRLYFLCYSLVTLSLFIASAWRAASPQQRLQAHYFLTGFFIPALFGIVLLNILQPLHIHGLDVLVTPLAIIPMTGIFAYAIVRHRLMGIEGILTQGIAYLISLALTFAPLSIAAIWMQQQVFGVVSYPYTLSLLPALILADLVFTRLTVWLQARVVQSFWQKGPSYQQIVNDFSSAIVRSPVAPSRQSITQSLKKILTEHFAPVTIALVHQTSPTQNSRTPIVPGERALREEDALVAWGTGHDGILVRAELELEQAEERHTQLLAALRAMPCEVCVPLKATGRLFGFITLDNKYDKKAYTLEDFHFLALLANEAAIALENARLYEDLKRSQELLARSDRLAALGTLAAGIAHEIRNPLVSIHTLTQLLPERLDDPEFRTTFLQLADSEVVRVCDLINDLMAFARPSPPVIHDVDVNETLTHLLRLLRSEAGKKGVHLGFSPAPFLPAILADEGQVKQVFMNLLLNALQATPAGGAVHLSTHWLDEQGKKQYCRVTVHDTGAGIADEHREQIFDPFFTTKDSGTGLGLFIAHQIITEHGGYIDVESAAATGTRLSVYLPYDPAPGR